MKRITITVDDALMDEVERMIEQDGYQTRSEAIRDLMRLGLRSVALNAGGMQGCVGILTYVYDYEARDMAWRLTASHHDNHFISIASMHIHLDEGNCLEVSILKGSADAVRDFAEPIISQKAVAYGELKIIPQRARSSG